MYVSVAVLVVFESALLLKWIFSGAAAAGAAAQSEEFLRRDAMRLDSTHQAVERPSGIARGLAGRSVSRLLSCPSGQSFQL